MKHKHDSEFYCGSKQCRKTVWNTPEYLEPSDWDAISKVIEILESKDVEAFLLFVRSAAGRQFFMRVIGWPEGYSYCYGNEDYVRYTAMPSIASNSLPKLRAALREL